MKEVRILCDRCGEQIKGTVYTIANFGDDDVLIRTDDDIDVCEKCAHEIISIWRGQIEKPKKTEKQRQPNSAAKKNIDRGKVKALSNAKWPVKEIAAEMGCSENNIYQILRKFKEDEEDAKL